MNRQILRCLLLLFALMADSPCNGAAPSSQSDLDLGKMLFERENFKSASIQFERALKTAETSQAGNAEIATCCSYLADCYLALDRFEDAEKLNRRALNIFEKLNDRRNIALRAVYLATAYMERQRKSEALPLYQRVLSIVAAEKKLAEDSELKELLPAAALGVAVTTKNDEEAEAAFKQTIALLEEKSKLGDDELTVSLEGLAALYQRQKRYDEAESLWKRSLAINERLHGPSSNEVGLSLKSFAGFLKLRERNEEAESALKRALTIFERLHGSSSNEVGQTLNELALVFQAEEKFAESDASFKRSLEILETIYGPKHANVAAILSNYAIFCVVQGRSQEAEDLYKRSLEIDQTPDTMHLLGCLYFDQGRFTEAQTTFNKSLTLWKKVEKPNEELINETNNCLRKMREHVSNCPDFIRALNQLSNSNQGTAQSTFDNSILRKLARLGIWRESEQTDTLPQKAQELDAQAKQAFQTSEHKQAIELYQQELKLVEAERGVSDIQVRRIKQNIIDSLIKLDDFEKAETWLLTLPPEHAAFFGTDPKISSALKLIPYLSQSVSKRRGNSTLMNDAERAVKSAEKGTLEYADKLESLALLQMVSNSRMPVVGLLKDSLKTKQLINTRSRKLNESTDESKIDEQELELLIKLRLLALGEIGLTAEPEHYDNKLVKPTSDQRYQVSTALALILCDDINPEAIKASLTAARSLPDETSYMCASSIGDLLLRNGDFKNAEQFYLTAQQIAKGLKHDQWISDSIRQRARLSLCSNDAETAKKFAKEASNADSQKTLDTTQILVDCAVANGDPDLAIKLCLNALSIVEKEDASKKSLLKLRIGSLLEAQGKDKEALTELFSGLSELPEYISGEHRLMVLGNAFGSLGRIATRQKHFKTSIDLLNCARLLHMEDDTINGVIATVYDYRELAVAHGNTSDQKQAEDAILEGTRLLQRYLDDTFRHLPIQRQILLSETAADQIGYLIKYCCHGEATSEAIPLIFGLQGMITETLRTASTDQDQATELAECLMEDEALVDVQLYQDPIAKSWHYAALVLSGAPGSTPEIFDLGAREEWKSEIDNWLKVVSNGAIGARDIRNEKKDSDLNSHCAEELALRAKLCRHLSDKLKISNQISKLWLCLDADFAAVPWNLILKESLAGKVLVSEIDSPKTLNILRSNSRKFQRKSIALLAGGINFREPSWYLKGTAEEIRALKSLSESRSITGVPLSGNEATKDRVIQGLRQASYAHLATHGFFGDKDSILNTQNSGADSSLAPMEPIALARSAVNVTSHTSDDPLSRSGILLSRSGNGDEEHDDVITARELVGLDLTGCKLVALSACNTGRGESHVGQGILGLRSALISSGVKSILMSLWPVNDISTRELMIQFYNRLWDKENPKMPAQALAEAQDYVKNLDNGKWQHPYFWAGWTIDGEAWPSYRKESKNETVSNAVVKETSLDGWHVDYFDEGVPSIKNAKLPLLHLNWEDLGTPVQWKQSPTRKDIWILVCDSGPEEGLILLQAGVIDVKNQELLGVFPYGYVTQSGQPAKSQKVGQWLWSSEQLKVGEDGCDFPPASGKDLVNARFLQIKEEKNLFVHAKPKYKIPDDNEESVGGWCRDYESGEFTNPKYPGLVLQSTGLAHLTEWTQSPTRKDIWILVYYTPGDKYGSLPLRAFVIDTKRQKLLGEYNYAVVRGGCIDSESPHWEWSTDKLRMYDTFEGKRNVCIFPPAAETDLVTQPNKVP